MREITCHGTEDIPAEEKVIFEHYFLPGTGWEWYVAELDERGKVAFGYVCSGLDPRFSEWGYFDMDELKGLKIETRLVETKTGRKIRDLEFRVERDRYFSPRKARDIQGFEKGRIQC